MDLERNNPMQVPHQREEAATLEGITPGRIVHYVAYGTPKGEYKAGAHRAAIMTETEEGRYTVSLVVLNPTGAHWAENVEYDPTGTMPGTWHWPERV